MGCAGSTCLSPPDVPANPECIDLSHFEQLKVNAITRKFDGALMALKRMAKCEVIKKESHIRMVWTERNIMAKLSDNVSNPFLVHLEHAFQNDRELFFVLPFCHGGDLRYHLTKRGLMTEAECRFIAAECVLGLESMHLSKIIYRDFKPENVLLDSEGHILLSDFGLAVQLEERHHFVMKGNAGTGGYLAPEVWAGEYYGVSPDFWSFGVSVYELLHGRRPYRRWNPQKDHIGKMKFLPTLSAAAKSFIKGLLTVDPRKRLGCGPSGWNEVKCLSHGTLVALADGSFKACESLDPATDYLMGPSGDSLALAAVEANLPRSEVWVVETGQQSITVSTGHRLTLMVTCNPYLTIRKLARPVASVKGDTGKLSGSSLPCWTLTISFFDKGTLTWTSIVSRVNPLPDEEEEAPQGEEPIDLLTVDEQVMLLQRFDDAQLLDLPSAPPRIPPRPSSSDDDHKPVASSQSFGSASAPALTEATRQRLLSAAKSVLVKQNYLLSGELFEVAVEQVPEHTVNWRLDSAKRRRVAAVKLTKRVEPAQQPAATRGKAHSASGSNDAAVAAATIAAAAVHLSSMVTEAKQVAAGSAVAPPALLVSVCDPGGVYSPLSVVTSPVKVVYVLHNPLVANGKIGANAAGNKSATFCSLEMLHDKLGVAVSRTVPILITQLNPIATPTGQLDSTEKKYDRVCGASVLHVLAYESPVIVVFGAAARARWLQFVESTACSEVVAGTEHGVRYAAFTFQERRVCVWFSPHPVCGLLFVVARALALAHGKPVPTAMLVAEGLEATPLPSVKRVVQKEGDVLFRVVNVSIKARMEEDKRFAVGREMMITHNSHPFFARIDWNAIQNKIIKPPIKPDLKTANCVCGDTLVALSNGFSRPIRDVPAGTHVLSFDERLGGHSSVATSALLDQGSKLCVELLFSDGRTITCTPDHRFMQPDGSWVTAQELQLHNSEIVAGLEYPTLIDDTANDKRWTLRLTESLGFDLDLHARSEHALAFAGLLGYAWSRAEDSGVWLSHSLDVEWMLRDMQLLTGEKALVTGHATRLAVQLPVALRWALSAVSLGAASLPPFLLHPDCPLSVIQAFLGGLFGATGQPPQRCGRIFSGVRVSLRKRLNVQMVEQLQALLKRVGIEESAFDLSSDTTLRFASTIGFRYACQKAMRLTAAVCFLRLQGRLQNPAAAFAGVPDLASDMDSVLHACDAAKFLKRDHGVPADAQALPTLRVQLIGRRPLLAQVHVWDLTVPATDNFLAQGLAAHNCSNQADLADQLIDKKPVDIAPNYQKYFTGFDYNINFGEWLIKNEVRKLEMQRRADEIKRFKAEHKLFKLKQQQLMEAQNAADAAAFIAQENAHAIGNTQASNSSFVPPPLLSPAPGVSHQPPLSPMSANSSATPSQGAYGQSPLPSPHAIGGGSMLAGTPPVGGSHPLFTGFVPPSSSHQQQLLQALYPSTHSGVGNGFIVNASEANPSHLGGSHATSPGGALGVNGVAISVSSAPHGNHAGTQLSLSAHGHHGMQGHVLADYLRPDALQPKLFGAGLAGHGTGNTGPPPAGHHLSSLPMPLASTQQSTPRPAFGGTADAASSPFSSPRHRTPRDGTPHSWHGASDSDDEHHSSAMAFMQSSGMQPHTSLGLLRSQNDAAHHAQITANLAASRPMSYEQQQQQFALHQQQLDQQQQQMHSHPLYSPKQMAQLHALAASQQQQQHYSDAGEEKHESASPANLLQLLEDQHVLMLTQNAHRSGPSGPISGFAQISLPHNDVRMSPEAELALNQFHANQRREKADAKRRARDLKHRTTLSQALLAVVRNTNKTPVALDDSFESSRGGHHRSQPGSSAGHSAMPQQTQQQAQQAPPQQGSMQAASEQEKVMAAKLAEMLQVDRQNLRRLMHGDSGSGVSREGAGGSHKHRSRGSGGGGLISAEMPGRIRSYQPSLANDDTQPGSPQHAHFGGNSHGSGGAHTPIFPYANAHPAVYSSSGLSPAEAAAELLEKISAMHASSMMLAPSASASSSSHAHHSMGASARMTHLGVPRFTQGNTHSDDSDANHAAAAAAAAHAYYAALAQQHQQQQSQQSSLPLASSHPMFTNNLPAPAPMLPYVGPSSSSSLSPLQPLYPLSHAPLHDPAAAYSMVAGHPGSSSNSIVSPASASGSGSLSAPIPMHAPMQPAPASSVSPPAAMLSPTSGPNSPAPAPNLRSVVLHAAHASNSPFIPVASAAASSSAALSSSAISLPAPALSSGAGSTSGSISGALVGSGGRHRIHVSVKPGASTRSSSIMLAAATSNSAADSSSHSSGGEMSRSGSIAASTSMLTPLPPVLPFPAAPVPSALSASSACVPADSSFVVPRNLLSCWSTVVHAIRRVRSSGRKLAIVVFLDYDGVLAPIVAVPSTAALAAPVRITLSRLCQAYPVSIVTGRALPTIQGFLAGVALTPEHPMHVAASHGFEITLDGLRGTDSSQPARVHQVGAEFVPLLTRFHARLRTALEQHPLLAAHLASQALALEHNRFSLAVHYRNLVGVAISGVGGGQSPPPSVSVTLLASLDALLSDLLDGDPEYRAALQRTRGKMVFEIAPRIPRDTLRCPLVDAAHAINQRREPSATAAADALSGWHKGCAMEYVLSEVLFRGETLSLQSDAASGLTRLRALESDCDVLPIYCGDDLTDEDAFRFLRPLQFAETTADAPFGLPAISVFVQANAATSHAGPSAASSPSDDPLTDPTLRRTPTLAHFSLRNTEEVHSMMQMLVELAKQI